MTIKLRARAKINLTLGVLGKRPDGYHEVEMVMQSIELHDLLTFCPSSGGINLTVEGSDLPAGEDNLVYRAAVLLREQLGTGAGADIRLYKYIPVAAGLGGGSADAAVTLAALNKLWGGGLALPDLMRLGEQLGADVPFCLLGGTALARGKGEVLKPLAPAPELGVVLVKPSFEVSTASVYRAYSPVSGSTVNNEAMLTAIREKNIAGIGQHLANDLEAVTTEMHPDLTEIKKKLREAGAMGVLMSGSGPTVYGLTPDLASAGLVAGRYQRSSEQVLVTKFSQAGNPCGFI